MTSKLWIASILLFIAGPAQAADWWWVGLNGDAPNRVVTYVDRESVETDQEGHTEVWALAVGEAALPNGQQHQATRYALNCRERSLGMRGRIAYAGSGETMPVSELRPEKLAPVVPGSIGESVLQLACGSPSGMEVRVPDPVQHAATFLVRGSQPPAQTEARPVETEQAQTASGTGFFVGPHGDILTNFHVIRGARRIIIVTAAGEELPAAVTRTSPANDLAVLRVNRRPTRYLGFAPPGAARPGDRVFTVGYPVPSLLGASEPRFTDGTVSALVGLNGESSNMQISVPLQPGNSGGPLVNEAGQVVGIVSSGAPFRAFLEATGTAPQNINWAVRAEYAAPLFGSPVPAPVRTRAQAIELTRDAVCFIYVELDPAAAASEE